MCYCHLADFVEAPPTNRMDQLELLMLVTYLDSDCSVVIGELIKVSNKCFIFVSELTVQFLMRISGSFVILVFL